VRGDGGDSHVLVVAGSGVLVIGGNVDLGAGADGEVLIVDGVTGSDFGTFLLGDCQY
jgi:hypothetical protein